MLILDTYLEDNFAVLAAPGARNGIFGAGRCGKQLLAKCRELGIKIEKMFDNSPTAIGSAVDGTPIVAPETLAKRKDEDGDVNVILGLSEAAHFAGALAQLEKYGVTRCFDAQMCRRFLVDSRRIREEGGSAAGDELDALEWLADRQGDFAWEYGRTQAMPHSKRESLAPCIMWGNQKDIERLGVQQYTRKWAYGWIIDWLRRIGRVETIADFGGGEISGYFASRLAHYADTVLVVDQFGRDGEQKGNIRQVVADMSRKITALPDASIDVVVTASAIEHMLQNGQINVFAEINRVLKPGGFLCGTISYVTNLTPENIAILRQEPMAEITGSPQGDPIDLATLLAAAPKLLLPDSLENFPGYKNFSESTLLADQNLTYDIAGSYSDVKCRPETDALRLKWYELALLLRKKT